MKEVLNTLAFSLPSVLFSPFPLNSRTSAYLCHLINFAVFVDPFPVTFLCPSLVVDPFVCWLIWIIPEMFLPFFSTCSLLNTLASLFVQSLLIVKAFKDSRCNSKSLFLYSLCSEIICCTILYRLC